MILRFHLYSLSEYFNSTFLHRECFLQKFFLVNDDQNLIGNLWLE
jgi:hypothetical protein